MDKKLMDERKKWEGRGRSIVTNFTMSNMGANVSVVVYNSANAPVYDMYRYFKIGDDYGTSVDVSKGSAEDVIRKIGELSEWRA